MHIDVPEYRNIIFPSSLWMPFHPQGDFLILGMDSFAFGLIKSAQLIEDGRIEGFTEKKYESFNTELGQRIRKGEATLEELASRAAELKAPKMPVSGKQEYLEGVLNNIILS